MRKVLLIALVLTAISAKSAIWEKVTDRSTIQEGKVYFIVSKYNSNYYMMDEYSMVNIETEKSKSLNCDMYSYYLFLNNKVTTVICTMYILDTVAIVKCT